MSPLTIFFAMVSGICLTIGAVHLIIWGGKRHRRVYLLSAGMALAAGAHSLLELGFIKSTTPDAMAVVLRWENLAVAATLLFMVWFVRSYLSAGRTWLAWAITYLWVIGLFSNFAMRGNLTFSEVVSIQTFQTVWGEPYSLARGITNPFKYVADAASLLIMIFVIDASITAWRRGLRRRAAVIGGSISFFIVVAGIHTPMVDAGIVNTPTLISLTFLAIIAAMSYQIARDVGRSHGLSEEVRAGQERWQSLLETVPMVVLDIDPEDRIRFANPFVLEMIGQGAGTVVGSPVRDFLDSREFDSARKWVPEEGGIHRPRELRLNLMDSGGEERLLAMTVMRLFDGEGIFAGALCVAADITQEVETALDLERTRRQLDRLMRSNLLGEFASSMAHELNQPLAAVLANAQVVRRYLDQSPPKLEEAREVMELIIKDDKRAAELIARLRAMLRQEDAPHEDLDLHQLLNETVGMLGRELRNHAIRIERTQETGKLMVRASRVEIQQVVLNLLLNAMQSLEGVPALEREIHIIAERTSGSVRVEVRDTGPGFPNEEPGRLFEPFNSEREGNIGMGLTICRRILESHGGQITAAANTPRGASFTMTLPLREMEGHGGG